LTAQKYAGFPPPVVHSVIPVPMKASALGHPLDQMIDAAGITPTVIDVYSLIALYCATLASISLQIRKYSIIAL
jgi:hypothetical protein